MQAYGSAYGTWNSHCHTSPSKVYKLGDSQIWAGRWIDMQQDLNWDLRIRLNDAWALRAGAGDRIINANQGAKDLLGSAAEDIVYPPTIDIDWEDYGTPPLDREWWQNLTNQIKSLKGPHNVAVYCQGGHGRTGTALSIMASLDGTLVPKNIDCVEFVRKSYCQEVVESWAQMNYIQDITGEELVSFPTSHFKAQGSVQGSAITGAKTPVYTQQEDGSYSVAWSDPTNVTKINANTSMFNHAKKKHHKKGK